MQNRAPLTLLLAANAISGFAQGISMLSIPWYFTAELNNGGLFAVVYMAVTVSTLIWSLYAGTLIDRFSRKKIFLGINIAGGIVLSSVAAYGFLRGEVPVEMIILVFALTVFIYNIHYPALYAFGQEITEKNRYGRTNSLFEIQGQATTILAGAVGAILLAGTKGNVLEFMGAEIALPFEIKKWTMHEIFLMDGITYLVSIILISFIKYTPVEKLEIHTGTLRERIATGINFLKENRLVFLFGNMSHAIFVILLIEVHLLLPWYVNNHLKAGADIYAVSEIFYAAGALFSGIAITTLFRKTNTVKAVITLMLVTTLFLFIAAFTKSIWVFLIFSLAIGLTNAGTRIMRITWLFNHIPNNMMGRAGSVFQMVNILLRTVFTVIFSIPFFSQGSNVIWTYFIGGVFILFSVVPLIINYEKLK